MSDEVIGTSKIDPRYRITLTKPIPQLLNVKIGDLIVFVKDREGNIVLRTSKIRR